MKRRTFTSSAVFRSLRRLLGAVFGKCVMTPIHEQSLDDKQQEDNMFDRTTHYVDRDLWTLAMALAEDLKDRGLSSFRSINGNKYPCCPRMGEHTSLCMCKNTISLIKAWDIRTSGSGRLDLSLLYALRAHMRGRVHCLDMTYEQQGDWLKEAGCYLGALLRPMACNTALKRYLRTTGLMLAARSANDQELEDTLIGDLDQLWQQLTEDEVLEANAIVYTARL